MKVFISWSGPRSRNIAEKVHKWLPYIIQPLKPFLSSGDIRTGVRWGDVLAHELRESKYGVICITRQNVTSPWLNFEAGALSNVTGHACVSPVLFGVDRSRLTGPLSQFQAAVFDEKGEEIFGLASSINDTLRYELRVPPDVLKATFYKWWPNIRADINVAMRMETEETETNLPWLYSVADLASSEGRSQWKAVWVINPEPLSDWDLLSETFQKNLKKGVNYDFIVPSDKVSVVRNLILDEVRQHSGSSSGGMDITNVRIGGLEQKEYDNLAATHYRVLVSKKDREPDKRVFFKIPIGRDGLWAAAEGAAVENFYTRFQSMRDKADPQPVCSLSQFEAVANAAEEETADSKSTTA